MFKPMLVEFTARASHPRGFNSFDKCATPRPPLTARALVLGILGEGDMRPRDYDLADDYTNSLPPPNLPKATIPDVSAEA